MPQGVPGALAAGGNSIDARSATSGVSGTSTNPRVGRSRSNVTRSSSGHEHGGEHDGEHATREDREVDREQAEGHCRADDLEEEHGRERGC